MLLYIFCSPGSLDRRGKSIENAACWRQRRSNTRHTKRRPAGLTCCKHMRTMLDDDQRQQDNGDLLRYHMKFRFWFQESVLRLFPP